ncbi:MAG: U32 family peptidase [Clostridia bacterium]|nr:U32 family peptidase [Clostridia bacterium]
MKRTARLPELLAPAGSPEALYAAVEAGADAVYLGLRDPSSNARASAVNFSAEELASLIPYCHGHGVKVYVTLNTLCHAAEMAHLTELAASLDQMGVDALIVADMGLARRLSHTCPSLPLHASTQAFCHSTRTADALYGMGFSRVVLARETDKENMARITQRAKPEIEVFLHGALCVSHSGECLFSSLVGGRSGNRGLCAQPCRLPYNGKPLLSLKDLCLASHVPALIEMGVSSLKIEGRMKSPTYVYEVTRVYRRLLDEGRAATREELQHLANVFSRDGFTDGYFTGKLSHMTGVRREEDKAASRQTEKEKVFSPLPIPVAGRAVFKRGEPTRLTLQAGSLSVTATGAAPESAQKAALTKEGVGDRLSKMGDTPFALKQLDLFLEDGLFMPVSAQNELRRKATDALQNALRKRESNTVLPLSERDTPPVTTLRTAHFFDGAAFDGADTSLFDICFLSFLALEEKKGDKMPNGVALPPVCFDSEEAAVLSRLKEWKKKGVTHALVSSLGGLALAKEAGLLPFGDLRLNLTNGESADRWRRMGLVGFVFSPELPSHAARRMGMGGSLTVYGRLPLMLTERCFVKENFGCDACGHARLTDRKGVSFPLLREYGHRTLIFNSLPTYLGDRPGETEGLGHHFIFTTETAREIDGVTAAYLKKEGLSISVRRSVTTV